MTTNNKQETYGMQQITGRDIWDRNGDGDGDDNVNRYGSEADKIGNADGVEYSITFIVLASRCEMFGY